MVARVTNAQHSKTFLDRGRLAIAIQQVEAVDGTLHNVILASERYPSINSVQNPEVHLTPDATLPTGPIQLHPSLATIQQYEIAHHEIRTPINVPPYSTDAANDEQLSGTSDDYRLVFGKTDSTHIPAAILTLAGTYHVKQISEKSSGKVGSEAATVFSLGTAVQSNSFNTLFIGVPSVLQANVTFAVKTICSAEICVKNPLTGQ